MVSSDNIVVDPRTTSTLCSYVGGWHESIQGNAAEGGVFQSLDSGFTWIRIPPLPTAQLALPPADLPNNRALSLGLSADDPNTLYVGVAGRNVARLTSRMATFLTPSTTTFTVINGILPNQLTNNINQLTNNIFATATVLFSGRTQITIPCPPPLPITYIVSDQNGNPITGLAR